MKVIYRGEMEAEVRGGFCRVMEAVTYEYPDLWQGGTWEVLDRFPVEGDDLTPQVIEQLRERGWVAGSHWRSVNSCPVTRREGGAL